MRLPLLFASFYLAALGQVATVIENPSNPVLVYSGSGWNAATVRDPSVWYGRGKCWALFTGLTGLSPGSYGTSIGIAYSSDCTTSSYGGSWTVAGQALTVQGTGQWNSGAVFSPAAYYESTTDTLYVYVSGAPTDAGYLDGPAKIGILTVASGLDWTNPANYVWQPGNPVLAASGGWEGTQGVYAAGVALVSGMPTMYYSSSNSAAPWRSGCATASSFGSTTWTKCSGNPVVGGSSGDYAEEPVVVVNGGIPILFSDLVTSGSGFGIWTTTDNTGQSGWSYAQQVVPGNAAWYAAHIGSQGLCQLPNGKWLVMWTGFATVSGGAANLGVGLLNFTTPGNLRGSVTLRGTNAVR